MAVTLVQAVIAADMMDFVVRKAVELGVFAIAPFIGARSQGLRRGTALRAAFRTGGKSPSPHASNAVATGYRRSRRLPTCTPVFRMQRPLRWSSSKPTHPIACRARGAARHERSSSDRRVDSHERSCRRRSIRERPRRTWVAAFSARRPPRSRRLQRSTRLPGMPGDDGWMQGDGCNLAWMHGRAYKSAPSAPRIEATIFYQQLDVNRATIIDPSPYLDRANRVARQQLRSGSASRARWIHGMTDWQCKANPLQTP